MTADLIERLRNRTHDSPMHAEHLMDEAADEIERLRACLEDIAQGRCIEDWSYKPHDQFQDFAQAVLDGREARLVNCPVCEGAGVNLYDGKPFLRHEDCTTCDGRGKVPRAEGEPA